MSSEPQVIKKKRGRKPKFKGDSKDTWKENVINTTASFDKYIMCLKIKKTDLENATFVDDCFCQYNPVINIPKPFSIDSIANKLSLYPLDDNQQDQNGDTEMKDVDDGATDNVKEEIDNNTQMEITKTENSIGKPMCWWCSINIEDDSFFALPIRYENKAYETIGSFCCPECAAAYNFECGSKYGNKWSQYNLLNNLYKDYYKEDFYHIKIAPPRELLKVFGGCLTYDQYQNIKANKKTNYNIVCPPIVPMNVQFEEELIENIEKPFIPIDDDKIKRAKSELILKRDKSLKNKNTLELFMGVKYDG